MTAQEWIETRRVSGEAFFCSALKATITREACLARQCHKPREHRHVDPNTGAKVLVRFGDTYHAQFCREKCALPEKVREGT